MAILGGMRDSEWSKILGWPGYRVYRSEIHESAKRLRLWVRRKRGNRKLVCSGCGNRVHEIVATYEREVRDLPWSQYRATVVIELHRVRCPDCGIKAEKVEQLPSKAPFSKRLEEAVGLACESAAVRRVARQYGLAASTVRGMDLRYLKRWAAGRRKPALRQMGVDEIHLGKKQKFLTVVSNLETGEPLWFGRERKKESLDEFFARQLSAFQRSAIRAACVDMWEPFRQSIEQWAPQCRIVYDKFHVMQHANAAVDEVRRAEFFRKGGAAREIVKGKRWLLLARWVHLNTDKKRQLNRLFALNRRVMKAYLLKESLDRLWSYTYEAAMLRYLKSWIDQLRWQRLKPMEKLARMLLNHVEGILNYCRIKVPLGVVEAVNGNIKALLRRGRGYSDLDYLLLKAQRLAATKTQFIVLQKAA
ncbi:MAG TPA: ISL3 family transposase [Candidatus Angelobacter sp.]|nr:ISL3 family transposase [Candidatus Angelobacter sp.]